MNKINNDAPIGVFDSGVGGLSVLKEIRQLMPNENLHYVADSGYAPYGHQSHQYIIDRCEHIVKFFHQQSVKAIVVACNTATSVAVDQLRACSSIPIIAMEPAIKPAALHTKTGRVAVLATEQTLSGQKINRLIAAHGKDIQVLLQPCSGFVELVECADLLSSKAEQLVLNYVKPLLTQEVDTLVLGCTHYPFLKPMIEKVAGSRVHIIDPSPAVARELRRRLLEKQLLSAQVLQGHLSFWSSGNTLETQKIIAQLWQEEITVLALPEDK